MEGARQPEQQPGRDPLQDPIVNEDVIVIGAGCIGLTAAYELVGHSAPRLSASSFLLHRHAI